VNLGMTAAAQEGYGSKAGMSMAAPHVSGVVALLLSLSPRLTAGEVKSVLQMTARPHPAGTYCAMGGAGCGAGLLDADAAVQHVVNNRPMVTVKIQSAMPAVRPASSFTLVGEVKAAGGRTASSSGMSWRQVSGPPVPIPAGVGASVMLTAPGTTGTLTFEYAATDTAGYEGAATVSLLVNAPPTMSTPVTSQAMVGKPMSGTLLATDAEGDTITYVLVAGPPGLNINAATGAWSWTPKSAGTQSVTVMPADAYGNGAQVNFAVSVTPDPNAKKEFGGIGAVPWWAALLLLVPAYARSSSRALGRRH
jgi:serine protease